MQVIGCLEHFKNFFIMHEISVIQSIFAVVVKIAAENNLKVVTKICLKIGKLRQLVPEFLQFALKTIAKDTIAETAELIIENVPIIMQCKSCAKEFIVAENIFICPNCNATDLCMISGSEVILDNIEGEK